MIILHLIFIEFIPLFHRFHLQLQGGTESYFITLLMTFIAKAAILELDWLKIFLLLF
jgi:hypothetical protein